MCVNAYEKLSDKSKKIMIFCKLKGEDGLINQLCISQRYCKDKDRYVVVDQKRECKYFESK